MWPMMHKIFATLEVPSTAMLSNDDKISPRSLRPQFFSFSFDSVLIPAPCAAPAHDYKKIDIIPPSLANAEAPW